MLDPLAAAKFIKVLPGCPPFQRSQTHGCVDAFAMLNGCDAGSSTQVSHNEVHLALFLSQHSGSLQRMASSTNRDTLYIDYLLDNAFSMSFQCCNPLEELRSTVGYQTDRAQGYAYATTSRPQIACLGDEPVTAARRQP